MVSADKTTAVEEVWQWLADVQDPEIPVLSVIDLGIVRDVNVSNECVEVAVAPTYSGCPATEVIESLIKKALTDRGVTNVALKRVLTPAWSSDWITAAGRQKLLDYGIAPPVAGESKRELRQGLRPVACPQCTSMNTKVVSEFGSTACKAAYRCETCLEPFEYFKCI